MTIGRTKLIQTVFQNIINGAYRIFNSFDHESLNLYTRIHMYVRMNVCFD